MVVDGAEEKQRAKLKAAWKAVNGDGESVVAESGSVPLWAQEREWGNDGLVTLQSAKWGEFLGILEGCDRKSKCLG
jgi:triacylglycerol lipase